MGYLFYHVINQISCSDLLLLHQALLETEGLVTRPGGILNQTFVGYEIQLGIIIIYQIQDF